MRNLKRNASIAGAAVILAALGIGGAVTAQASTNNPAPIVQQSDGDGEVDDATEVEGSEGAEETNDGPNQGPDANPNEPGHQDADESGETDSEEADGTEGAEEANDGPNQGPDANPNEPGHQDADESGETE